MALFVISVRVQNKCASEQNNQLTLYEMLRSINNCPDGVHAGKGALMSEALQQTTSKTKARHLNTNSYLFSWKLAKFHKSTDKELELLLSVSTYIHIYVCVYVNMYAHILI